MTKEEHLEENQELIEEALQIGEKWYNMGFREGVLKGKTEIGQDAFDFGYYKGALGGFLEQAGEILPIHIRREFEAKLDQLSG